MCLQERLANENLGIRGTGTPLSSLSLSPAKKTDNVTTCAARTGEPNPCPQVPRVPGPRTLYIYSVCTYVCVYTHTHTHTHTPTFMHTGRQVHHLVLCPRLLLHLTLLRAIEGACFLVSL
jgi:hypothetical protein